MTKPVFSGFPTKRDSDQSPKLQRLARKLKILLTASLDMKLYKKRITKALIRLCGCAGWSAPLLFPNPECKGPNTECWSLGCFWFIVINHEKTWVKVFRINPEFTVLFGIWSWIKEIIIAFFFLVFRFAGWLIFIDYIFWFHSWDMAWMFFTWSLWLDA